MTLWDIIADVTKIKTDLENGDYISALGDLAAFISDSQVKVGFPLPTSGAKPVKGKKGTQTEAPEEATVETLMAEIDSIDAGTPKRGRSKVGVGGGFQDWAGFIAETLRNFVNTWVKTHPPEPASPEPGDSHGGVTNTTEES